MMLDGAEEFQLSSPIGELVPYTSAPAPPGGRTRTPAVAPGSQRTVRDRFRLTPGEETCLPPGLRLASTVDSECALLARRGPGEPRWIYGPDRQHEGDRDQRWPVPVEGSSRS